MEKAQIVTVEGHIKTLRSELGSLKLDSDLEELLKVIHHPGYTTPAESVFVQHLLQSQIAQVKAIKETHNMLIKGCQMIVG